MHTVGLPVDKHVDDCSRSVTVFAFAMQYNEGTEAQEVAYHHVRKTIQDVQNLSRYHGLRAALSMLAFQVSNEPL